MLKREKINALPRPFFVQVFPKHVIEIGFHMIERNLNRVERKTKAFQLQWKKLEKPLLKHVEFMMLRFEQK